MWTWLTIAEKKCNKTFIWRKNDILVTHWHKKCDRVGFHSKQNAFGKNTPGKPNEFEPEGVSNCEKKNGKDWHNHECFSLRCNFHLNNFDGPERGRRESEQFHNVQTLMPDSFQAHQNSKILYKTCLTLPILLFPCNGQC